MSRKIFKLLSDEQIFEYRKLKRTYGSAIARNYAKLVISAAYLYRQPRAQPRERRSKR